MRQLETNQLDMDATLEELSVQQETEDQNYGMYVAGPARAGGVGAAGVAVVQGHGLHQGDSRGECPLFGVNSSSWGTGGGGLRFALPPAAPSQSPLAWTPHTGHAVPATLSTADRGQVLVLVECIRGLASQIDASMGCAFWGAA